MNKLNKKTVKELKLKCKELGIKHYSNKKKNELINLIKQTELDDLIDKVENIKLEEKISIQKPFIKWVGGKTQLLDSLRQYIPKKMVNYHELFLGGGSMLLYVLYLKNSGEIKIDGTINVYDINEHLINTYKVVQNNTLELYNKIEHYFNIYKQLDGQIINRKPLNIEQAKTSKESYYYWLRNKYNNTENIIDKSALFIILNKTGFRGLYREGPNGFNVPFGNYKNLKLIISKEELEKISNLIKEVKFNVCSFKESINKIKKGDFVYLDPPYYPENETSFVNYTKLGFNKQNHYELFDKIKLLNKQKIKFVMSNSNTKYVNDYFKEYNKQEITAKRSINSKNPGSKTKEVIIYN